METADKAFNIFKSAIALIPSGDKDSNDPILKSFAKTHEWGDKVISGYTYAKEMVDSDEKEARLVDGITKETSQIMFVLYRHQLTDPKLEEEYHKLPLFEATDSEVNKFLKVREEEVKKVGAERDAIGKIQRELDIFQAVLTQGMTPEDAEAEMQKYEARQQAGMPREA